MDNLGPLLPSKQSRILRLLRSEGPLSRWQLHEQTGLRPNTVGKHVADLLKQGLLCEQTARTEGPGRPRVPLGINPSVLHVAGAAIRPGYVEACRLNLCGQVVGRFHRLPVERPAETVFAVGRLFQEIIDERTFLLSLSTTGFVDPQSRRILFSSSLPGQQSVLLDALFEFIGDRLLVVDNDMHALAARWLQEHLHQIEEDILLIYFDDGQLGSALLVRGEPNRGCLVGGNELGHTRLPIETEPCYCGHTGCLERIGSTDFLRRHGVRTGTLLEHVQQYDGTEPAMNRMIGLVASGLANAVNFVRPHRVVLASPYTSATPFVEALVDAIRSRLLVELVGRVQYHFWDQAATGAGETAGWMALAGIYHPDWTKSVLLRPRNVNAR